MSQASSKIARGTQRHSEEFLKVTTILQQVSETSYKEKDGLILKSRDSEAEEYLN